MYQIKSTDETINMFIDKIYICCDEDSKKNNFIFLKNDLKFHQIYLDEKVLFINLICQQDSFEEYLEDLNQVVVAEIDFIQEIETNITYFINENHIIFKNQKLHLKIHEKNNEFFMFSNLLLPCPHCGHPE